MNGHTGPDPGDGHVDSTDIGGSPNRVGGVGRVTGRQAYVADIPLEDVLHVKLVTLEAPRARIVSIDPSAALRVPGVRLVMTPDDLPRPMPRFGPQFRDRPVLAVGETKFHGDPVAAVAAETLDAAEEGARQARVAWEALPAVTTLDASLAGGAPNPRNAVEGVVCERTLRARIRAAGTRYGPQPG